MNSFTKILIIFGYLIAIALTIFGLLVKYNVIFKDRNKAEQISLMVSYFGGSIIIFFISTTLLYCENKCSMPKNE